MRIVLDTNVLISGIFFAGYPYEILDAWRQGRIEIATSPEILDERGRHVMTGVLENKRQAIAAACMRHGVVRLDVFGSALRDDFNPDESDLDLLVEFGPMEPYARVDAYFGMLEELRAELGLEIDLVMVGAVKNPYIARDIERTRQILSAA